jgi:hypothetical protein
MYVMVSVCTSVCVECRAGSLTAAAAAAVAQGLLREVGAAIGREARSFGTTECWSPIMGLAREVPHPGARSDSLPTRD